jgi:metal transporter CNNM
MAAPYVAALMYAEAPIAYPVARLLDRMIGESHGVVYKKAELRTFVSLHGRKSSWTVMSWIDWKQG